MNFEHAKVKIFIKLLLNSQSEISPRWLDILREDYFLQLCEVCSFRLLHKCDCFFVVRISRCQLHLWLVVI